jgi:hypothetical protein
MTPLPLGPIVSLLAFDSLPATSKPIAAIIMQVDLDILATVRTIPRFCDNYRLLLVIGLFNVEGKVATHDTEA